MMRLLLLLALGLAGCVPSPPTMRAYTARWCPACQVDKPRLEAAAAVYAVEIIDADASPERLKADGVQFLPFYIVCDGQGRELIRTADLEAALNVLGR